MKYYFKIIYEFLYFLSVLLFCFVVGAICYIFYLENILKSFVAGIFIILFAVFCAGWKIYYDFKKTAPTIFSVAVSFISDLLSFVGMVSIFYLYFVSANKNIGYIAAELFDNKISVFFNILNAILISAFISTIWKKMPFKGIYKILLLCTLFPILYLILFILAILSKTSAMESYYFFL